MRISDWSSDVCSSDLYDRQRHRHAQDDGQPAAFLVAQFDDAADLLDVRLDDIHADAAPGYRSDPCRGRKPGAKDQFELVLRGQRARLRSEEHTSELQSLMRTSYAVCCLKKNTHHLRAP